MTFNVEHIVDSGSDQIEIEVATGSEKKTFFYPKTSLEGQVIQALIDGEYTTAYVEATDD